LADGDLNGVATNIRMVDFTALAVAAPREAHFIVRVTDSGAPPLPATSG